MDAKWFKTQKKKAGVNDGDIAAVLNRDRSIVSKIASGAQRMSLDWAQAFATALNVPLSEVLERSGATDPATAQAAAPGFGESDAAPFLPAPDMGAAARSQLEIIGRTFGQRPGVDVWQVKSRTLELAGFLPGDMMLVDTFATERLAPGDIVVAQVYSRTGAKTVLRRWLPPVLVAATMDKSDEQVFVVDNDNVSIRGKVMAQWRTS